MAVTYFGPKSNRISSGSPGRVILPKTTLLKIFQLESLMSEICLFCVLTYLYSNLLSPLSPQSE